MNDPQVRTREAPGQATAALARPAAPADALRPAIALSLALALIALVAVYSLRELPLRAAAAGLAGLVASAFLFAVMRSDARMAARLRRAEDALRESEDRARLTLARLLDAVITIDAAGRVLDWSPRAETLFGWSAAEAGGRPLSELVVPPSRRAAYERSLARLGGAAGEPLLERRLELTALRRDGTEFPVELAVTVVQLEGSTVFRAFVRDITDRRQAEAALRESEARFRLLFDSNPLPMWLYDVETWFFLEVNPAAVAQYGYSRDEFLRMRVPDIWPPAVPWPESVISEFRPGEVRRASRKHRLKDGRVRDVEVIAQSIEFGGRPAALVVPVDVTELKQNEAAIAQYTERLSLLRSVDHAIISAADPRTIADAAVRRLAPLLGDAGAGVVMFDHAAAEAEWIAVGRDGGPIAPGRRMPLTHFGDLTALRRGEVQHIDMRSLPESEITRAVLATGLQHLVRVPLLAAGALIGCLSVGVRGRRSLADEQIEVAREVAAQLAIAIAHARLHERALAFESRFRALVEGSIQGVYVTGADLRVRYANAATSRIFGCRRPEDLVGRPVLDFFDPSERARMRGYAAARARGEAAPSRYEARARRRDGTPVWVELLVSAVTLEGEQLLQTALIDISERRAAQEALERSEAQLRQAQKMEAMGRLAGGVAHDFNNLLTVIAGRAHLLGQRLVSTERAQKDVEIIQKTAERAAALTNQLLAFSRRQVMRPSVLDLNAVVENAISILGRLLGEDVELRALLSPKVGRIRADVTQLEQVLFNLAVNARDAMPHGGRITIESADVELDDASAGQRPGLAPGWYVTLAVTDTGHGMDAATQAQIFEPFFTTKEPGKGTGLGLSTVYGIVAQSEGHIAVESEVGKGSTFTIYLPRADASADVASGMRPEAPPRGTETVLLVEDEDDVRELAREILERGGYVVLDAATPAQGLELAGRHAGPIHALVTDVVMPGMNGRALAEALVQRYPEVKVVYMSGYPADVIGRQGVLDPDVVLVRKPFSPSLLLRTVRRVLDG